MKVSDLVGAPLDYAVAKAIALSTEEILIMHGEVLIRNCDDFTRCRFSTDWVQGGPIIEREKIRLDVAWSAGNWHGYCKIDGVTGWMQGPTPLIAAMRCFVASKLGDEVEIPDCLLKGKKS